MLKKYSSYINESQVVILDDGNGGNMFKTFKYGSKNSIGYLNNIIKKFVESIYGPHGFVYGHNVDVMLPDGRIINGEYISKMVNNYTVFKSVIRINNIKDEESFYNFMVSNLNDIYSPDGRFFTEQTLPILINTTRRGNALEKMAIGSFEEFAKSKNLHIIIKKPSTEEDIRGIDFIFFH